ncbi:MAG: acyl-CoA dehydrogenase family protein [Gemmatimonadales bacterium]
MRAEAEGREDGLAGERLYDSTSTAPRCPRRTSARRVGAGVRQLPEDAGRRPDRDRRPVPRRSPKGAYRRRSVRRHPEAVRPVHREGRGRQLQAGRHGDGDRRRAPPPLHGRPAQAGGKPFRRRRRWPKLFCSELAMRAATQAVQVFGGYGYTSEYPVERMMRDAKVCEIGGDQRGQRMVIAREILGGVVKG